MPNWWEDTNFTLGNWGNIQSGAQSHYDPAQGRMEFQNPDGGSYFMPFTPGAMTGGGLTPNPTPGAAGGGMDPYYGYGYLFGQPGAGAAHGGLSALGGGDVMQHIAMNPGSQLAARAPGAPGQFAGHPWNPKVGPTAGPPGPATTEGNITYSPVGSQEALLDKLFRGSITGQGGGPIAQMLYNMGLGQLPPAMAQGIIGQTNEQFGKMGARFGTDLGTAQARGLAQAAETRSLDAIQQILGLGGTTAGFQFARGENAMERALREFIAQQQADPMNNILQSLLGG